MIYTGNEHFMANGEEIKITMMDFWKWSHPDFLSNERRAILSEFIVASSLGLSEPFPQDGVNLHRPYALLTRDGLRLQVGSASYLQSADEEHPDYISFDISEITINSDAYVFCLYKATSKSQNPLDLNLWEFFVVPTKTIIESKPTQKTITLPRLQEIGVWQCDYFGIADGLNKAMDV